jgi:hypothetical protein
MKLRDRSRTIRLCSDTPQKSKLVHAAQNHCSCIPHHLRKSENHFPHFLHYNASQSKISFLKGENKGPFTWSYICYALLSVHIIFVRHTLCIRDIFRFHGEQSFKHTQPKTVKFIPPNFYPSSAAVYGTVLVQRILFLNASYCLPAVRNLYDEPCTTGAVRTTSHVIH